MKIHKQEATTMFKRCSLCNHPWRSREGFLADPALEIVGYQVCFDDPKDGLFLFNHQCKTTLALKVNIFEDLHTGIRYSSSATGTEDCSGFCIDMEELSSCTAQCRYAFVRDIIQIIKRWPKG